jgi:RimJ/RimL family protein N-acetyltransferase
MLDVPIDSRPALDAWFAPERPGPLIHPHIVRTGIGHCRADRWPDPRAVLAEVGGNYALRGDPRSLRPADLADIAGFVEAPPDWESLLRATDPGLSVWPRIIATLPAAAPATATAPADVEVRRIGPADAQRLIGYDPDGSWIGNTWGGPDGLATAAVGHGAFAGGRLVAVAVPFYLGARYADLGVVTEPAARRRGLSAACAAAVVADVRARGLVPTWTTSPDNAGSLAVAARLGFVRHRDDVLYVVRTPLPLPNS